MFSRRRATSNPSHRTPPSQAAATAAAQAFLANRASNASLSSAAAAAALRSQPSSPTAVAQIQTKRMIQRNASVSSAGSAPALQRQNSSGSMSERTFRSPSPNRPPAHTQEEYPPVPALPKSYATPGAHAIKPHRRQPSLEPPYRVVSPLLLPDSGRRASFDQGPGKMTGKLSKPPNMQNASLGSSLEDQPGKRSSINFSRPMSPQNSPPTSPVGTVHPRHTTRTAADAVATSTIQRDNAPNPRRESLSGTPVRKKKKKTVMVESRGQTEIRGLEPKQTDVAIREAPPDQIVVASQTGASQQNETQTIQSKKKKRRIVATPGRVPANYNSDSDAGSEQSYSSDRPRSFNTRAAGLLMKQPSIVREEREAEEQEERANSTNPSTIKSIETNGHAKASRQLTKLSAELPSETSLSPTLRIETSAQVSALPTNRNSLSPVRAAHFSSQPMYETPDGVKHQPPARSFSPVKSALKNSPSSRGTSPMSSLPGVWNRPGMGASDASDTTSIVSEDGYRNKAKRKNKVSFEDDPSILGQTVTPPTSHDSPVSQAKESTKKSWFGIGRGKKKSLSNADSDNDDVIKPMPALPSFGSIRGMREHHEYSPVATSSSERQEHRPNILNHQNMSSDQAVGAIIAQSLAAGKGISNASPDNPLPPEVTSVEGTGYHSDSDTSLYSHDGNLAQFHSHSVNEAPITSQKNTTNVPTISVQPATPGIDESVQQNNEWIGAAAGSGNPTEHAKSEPSLHSVPTVEHNVKDLSPATVGIAEPQPEAAAAYHEPGSPVVGEISESLRQQTAPHEGDDDDSGDSIYSDAAEDISDGDGFGSINAIVESPSIPKILPLEVFKPNVAEHETAKVITEPIPEEGWDKAQMYWSGLSQSRKSQIEVSAHPQAMITATEVMTKPKKKKKKIISVVDDRPSTQPYQPTQTRSSKTPSVNPLSTSTPLKARKGAEIGPLEISAASQPRSLTRKSTEPGDSQIRSSLLLIPADSEPSQLRSSMRTAAPKQTSQLAGSEKGKIVSGVLEPDVRGALRKKRNQAVSAVPVVNFNQRQPSTGLTHTKFASAGIQLTPVPVTPPRKTTTTNPIHRQTSNGSDSASSFKKARSTTHGSHTMRRSMRATSGNERPQSDFTPSSRLSVRSASPMSSTRRPFSSGPSMRSSMRNSVDSGRAKSPTKSLGFGRAKSPVGSFGFGRSQKSVPAPLRSSKPASRFSSRFNDSSDEDDGPRIFSSRFADSSDEDERAQAPTYLTPVRGIPRRIDEGDSTDLEDSSEEVVPSNTGPATAVSEKEGFALGLGSLRSNGPGQPQLQPVGIDGLSAAKEKPKRSFFGTLGRRKDKSKIVKADVESAARRDTPLERSKFTRSTVNGVAAPEDPVDSPVPSPRSPKLQRRTTPVGLPTTSWPLVAAPGSAVLNDRPRTSDGVVPGLRPDIGARRVTSQSAAPTVLGRTGKKKRFPMLRKAFGLHD